MSPLKFLVVPPQAKHTATVIFLHGLGDTDKGWKPVADFLVRKPGLQHIKWILPHAPTNAVTLNGGVTMPSWFDIYTLSFSPDSPEDRDGMLKSAASLTPLIQKEIEEGTPSRRIVLGGFSQGGVMSLLVGLTAEYQLGGLIVLSGWLPLRNDLKPEKLSSQLPIFWGHGTADPLVPHNLAGMSRDFLLKKFNFLPLGVDKIGEPGLVLKSYDGLGHSSSDEEVEDMGKFLARAIPKE